MSDLPTTNALLDTENLFRGFRVNGGPHDRERGRLIRHFPTVTPEVSAALGALAAHDFVDWLEARCQLQCAVVDKRHDPSVEATRRTLEDRGFKHIDVSLGKDQADIAVVDTVDGLAGAADGGHIALGGEDNLVLGAAAELASAPRCLGRSPW